MFVRTIDEAEKSHIISFPKFEISYPRIKWNADFQSVGTPDSSGILIILLSAAFSVLVALEVANYFLRIKNLPIDGIKINWIVDALLKVKQAYLALQIMFIQRIHFEAETSNEKNINIGK